MQQRGQWFHLSSPAREWWLWSLRTLTILPLALAVNWALLDDPTIRIARTVDRYLPDQIRTWLFVAECWRDRTPDSREVDQQLRRFVAGISLGGENYWVADSSSAWSLCCIQQNVQFGAMPIAETIESTTCTVSSNVTNSPPNRYAPTSIPRVDRKFQEGARLAIGRRPHLLDSGYRLRSHARGDS